MKPESTITAVNHAETPIIDQLLLELPAQLVQPRADPFNLVSAQSRTVGTTTGQLNIHEKRDILTKVLRSPQFTQSLASLTAALRNGGLPTISDALHVRVPNGGRIQQGRMPLGGGEAIEAFVEAVKDKVEKTLRSDMEE